MANKELNAFEIFENEDLEKNEIKFAEIKANDLEGQYTAISSIFGKSNAPQKLWEELELAKNRLKMLQKKAEKESMLKQSIDQLVEECNFKPVLKPVSKNNLYFTDKVECRPHRMEAIGVKIDISQVSGSIDVCFANGALEDLLLIRFCPDRREIYFDICQTKDWQITLEAKFREINMNFMEQAEIIYMIRFIRETLITHGYRTCDKFGF
jgi:hypothetical protein